MLRTSQWFDAVDVENHRPVRVRAWNVLPGECAPIALPHKGRRATEYVAGVLSGDEPWWDSNRNETDRPIRIYEKEWADTGNSAGWCWESDVSVQDSAAMLKSR